MDSHTAHLYTHSTPHWPISDNCTFLALSEREQIHSENIPPHLPPPPLPITSIFSELRSLKSTCARMSAAHWVIRSGRLRSAERCGAMGGRWAPGLCSVERSETDRREATGSHALERNVYSAFHVLSNSSRTGRLHISLTFCDKYEIVVALAGTPGAPGFYLVRLQNKLLWQSVYVKSLWKFRDFHFF